MFYPLFEPPNPVPYTSPSLPFLWQLPRPSPYHSHVDPGTLLLHSCPQILSPSFQLPRAARWTIVTGILLGRLRFLPEWELSFLQHCIAPLSSFTSISSTEMDLLAAPFNTAQYLTVAHQSLTVCQGLCQVPMCFILLSFQDSTCEGDQLENWGTKRLSDWPWKVSHS